MKNILFIFAFFITTAHLSFGQQDAIEKFFNEYQEDPNFTVVYVSPKMFGMISKITGEDFDQDLKEIVSNLKSLRVLTTKVGADKVYKDATKRINTTQYELLLTARDKGQNINFFTRSTKNDEVIEELLLLVGGTEEFVMLSFLGSLDLNKLSKMASKLNIDGAEHLEKLKK